MNRLSTSITEIKTRYDVVVIGSGYGGAITASRLARAGLKVCVLERGKERQAGEFPATSLEGAEELQLDLPDCHQGSRTGLFDFHVNRDITVLVGCGLGGTSLINANVSIRPSARVLDDPRWPAALREERGERLEAGFALAEKMLGASPLPADKPQPPKLVALRTAAEVMKKKFSTLPLNITWTSGYNQAGVYQRACALCGDCAAGCNHGSKNTVLMNYLPDAKRHGAEIFVEASVRWIERTASGAWAVRYQVLGTGREGFDAPTLFVTADIVILAAGTLGSTEILLRSKNAGGLAVSDRLGHGFSGNGDVLGIAYNTTPEIRAVGLGQAAPDDCEPLDPSRAIGPCISGVIDMRGDGALEEDMILEEGVIPSVLAPLLPAIERIAALGGTNTAPMMERLAQQAREAQSALLGPYQGAVNHTGVYLVMGHDGSGGAMSLENDRLRVAWPGIGSRPLFTSMNDRVAELTRALEGTYIVNPTWHEQIGKSLVTVHPLGGCCMADAADRGVVDASGKVFSGSSGAAVHEGLYVCDGSILPMALGVNPLFTISALAERCAMIIAKERGLTIDYSLKGPIPADKERRTVGIRFTETMKGYVSPTSSEDYAAAAAIGEERGSPFNFIVTIVADDVDDIVNSPAHRGRLVGTSAAPMLSPAPLVITRGVFSLFIDDPSFPGGRLMKYEMVLTAEDGRTFYFVGFKTIRDRPLWDLWRDTTTLFSTIYEGTSDQGPVVARGILRIAPDDFIRQLGTMEATNAPSAIERVEATVKFGRFFAGVLYDRYGGIAAPSFIPGKMRAFSDEGGAPRKRRPLRISAPEFFPIRAADGAEILLTRHKGGVKGPVLLAHGLGASSQVFAIDTLETSLVEYLFAKGYDVWLLDDRSSALLPASPASKTADDIAQRDVPAAVAEVLAASGAPSLQVFGHDTGALAITMAMLSGLSGVRAAVFSQLGLHIELPASSPLRNGFSTGEAAESLCDREQLDDATSDAITEIFVNVAPDLSEHCAVLAKSGHVVSAKGEEIYMPYVDRLAIPIRLLHGALNACFSPEGTARDLDLLAAKNGPELYDRRVVEGYNHGDMLFGPKAALDVYPLILEHFEKIFS